jgi:hypothetical protein
MCLTMCFALCELCGRIGCSLSQDQINRYLRSSSVRRGEAAPEGDDFLARGGSLPERGAP